MSEYQSLINFVEQNAESKFTRNGNIECSHVFAFMRIARHNIDGKITKTLDIGRVESEENNRGHFSRFLKEVERLAKKHQLVVFIESILNPDLVSMLKRRGYQIEGDPISPNAWRSMESVEPTIAPE